MSLHQIKAELCSVWGSDKDAAHAAWASTYDIEKLEQKTDEDIKRMASNLVVHGHDTPKERVWMEWFITCPIFVERQYDKYRMTVQAQDIQVSYLVGDMARQGITQNELSGRYRTIPDRPYGMPDDVADIVARANVYHSAENRYRESFVEALEHAKDVWRESLNLQHTAYQDSLKLLREAEAAKVISNNEYKRAREVLRGQLGTAFLTDMRLVFNLNAFEWIINQRIVEHAQAESQVLAYRLLVGARDNEVAKTIIGQMIIKNNWQSRIDSVEDLLAKERL